MQKICKMETKQLESEMVLLGEPRSGLPNILHRCKEYCWVDYYTTKNISIYSYIPSYTSRLKAIEAGWKFDKGEWTCPSCSKKMEANSRNKPKF